MKRRCLSAITAVLMMVSLAGGCSQGSTTQSAQQSQTQEAQTITQTESESTAQTTAAAENTTASQAAENTSTTQATDKGEVTKTTTEKASTKTTEKENAQKSAVVYFSATGTTEAVAETIAEQSGADLFEIVPKDEYTDDDLNYTDDACRANVEMENESARPAIKNDLSKVSQYDVVYIGYPIWWGTAPRIIQTFIEGCDLSNATVYLFCTSGGSSISQSVSDLKGLYPDVNIVSGKLFNSSSASEINAWLDELD